MLPQDTTHLIQRPCYQRGSPCQDPAGNRTTCSPSDHRKKRRTLQWYGHVSRSSGLAKTILQRTMKGRRRQSRQKKRLEDNIREWTGLKFAKSQRAVENREKMEETGCEAICGVPTTLAVKGLWKVKKKSKSWSQTPESPPESRQPLYPPINRPMWTL